MNKIKVYKSMVMLLLTTCLGLNGFTQKSFEVKAKIRNADKYTYYLAYSVNGEFKIDTKPEIKNGWAIFKGTVDEPVLASFGLRGNPELLIKMGEGIIPGHGLNFFLTNEAFKIEGEANKVYASNVSGGLANKDWNRIKPKENKLIDESWIALKNAYKKIGKNNDSSYLESAYKLNEKNKNRIEQMHTDFMNKFPKSLLSMYFLSTKVNELSLDVLKTDFSRLGNKYKNTSFAKQIQEKIANMDATALGKYAIPFTKKDLNGNSISLESLKGKIVLLDFWGSWCVPCRQSFPYLKELYSKYKNDGFEILGIALEQGQTVEDSKAIWKKTVKEDDLPWLQVLNNEEKEVFDAVKSYGVTAFPTQILLDKEGKIIARYVGESGDLDELLKSVFKK
ncbi:MAG: AhpC/TSA family protein [Chitinophagaceae bacterium]|nr:MAG: AhpC/TSA family protein [Chitinophagaceae bacterium]